MTDLHIETDRLTIGPIAEADAAFMRVLVNTQGWLRFIGDRNIHSDEQALAYIRRIKGTPDFHYWLVRLKSSGLPIGIISYLKRSYLDHFDIGFAFLPQYNGRGYAFEAARKMLDLILEMNPNEPVLATTLPDNERSITLLKKIGLTFQKEVTIDSDRLLVFSTPLNGHFQG